MHFPKLHPNLMDQITFHSRLNLIWEWGNRIISDKVCTYHSCLYKYWHAHAITTHISLKSNLTSLKCLSTYSVFRYNLQSDRSKHLPHLYSSRPSEQSFLPSHRLALSIHWWFWHSNMSLSAHVSTTKVSLIIMKYKYCIA